MKINSPETIFGLIGKKLSHSFSAVYFNEKFKREKLPLEYQLFELKTIEELPQLLRNHPALRGFNVTIPYKESMLPYLDELDPLSAEIGVVNTIVVDPQTRRLKGYNTDIVGFTESIRSFIKDPTVCQKVLIVGNGASTKTVAFALRKFFGTQQITVLSRTRQPDTILYSECTPSVLREHHLIINTTPLGMFPAVDAFPPLAYEALGPEHYLYDLIYNPPTTLFLQKGNQQKCKTQNGLQMLHTQAEKSWEIWKKKFDF